MKKDFQIEVIMNPAIFTSEKMAEQPVISLLNWVKESISLIATADEQIHQMYYLDKTQILVSIYQN